MNGLALAGSGTGRHTPLAFLLQAADAHSQPPATRHLNSIRAGPQTEHLEAVSWLSDRIMLDVTRIGCLRLTRWPPTFGSALIVSFANKRTEAFYRGRRVAAFSGFARTASRKMDQLDAATGLSDLMRPGNRLEALKGGRRGQWSIRINDQWRICFEWPEGSPGPVGVEIVDYH